MDRAGDLQVPASVGVASPPLPLSLPPRVKPASWNSSDTHWIASVPGVQLLAAPEGASVEGNLLKFPKAQFPTQDAARKSLATLYPSLAYANANQDGTYNLYHVKLFSTGVWNGDAYSTKDLDDMVQADKEIGHQLKPWIKYGHDEAQAYANSAGLPRGGTVRNLVREGDTLFGDIVNIPPPVYHAMEQKSWEGRSPEIYWDLPFSGNGKTYRRALRAIAILGAELPANPTLGDVFHAYTDETTGGQVHVAHDYAADLVSTPDIMPTALAGTTLFSALLPAIQRRYPDVVVRGLTIGDQQATGEWEVTLELDKRGETINARATLTPDLQVHFQDGWLPEGGWSPEQQRRAQLARDGLLIPGVSVRITHPAGTVRTGFSKDGEAWRRVLPFDYGEIPGTVAEDGDNLDVILAALPAPDAALYAVQQLHADGTPDEKKYMLGFESADAAKAAYLAFAHTPEMFGGIAEAGVEELQPVLTLAYTFNAGQKRDGTGKWTTLEGFHQAAARDLPRGAARNAHLATMHAARAAKALKRGEDATPHLAALTLRTEALRVHAHRSKQPQDENIHAHYRDMLGRLKAGDTEGIAHHEKPVPPAADALLEKAHEVLRKGDSAVGGLLHQAATSLADSHKAGESEEAQRHAANALAQADKVARHLHLLPSASRADALSIVHAVHARRDELGLPNPWQPVGTPVATSWRDHEGHPELFGYDRAPTYTSFNPTFDEQENRTVHQLTGTVNLADLHARLTGQHPALARASTSVKVPNRNTVQTVTSMLNKQGGVQFQLRRTFRRGKDGNVSVSHDLMQLSPALQGKGIGTHVAQSGEELARAAGASRIDLTASMGVGGYAWARQGFDFADEADRTAAKKRIGKTLDKYRNAGALDDEEHAVAHEALAGAHTAAELAAFTLPHQFGPTLTPEQRKVGKRGMLGSTWQATKDLSDTSASQTGAAYRKARLALSAQSEAASPEEVK